MSPECKSKLMVPWGGGTRICTTNPDPCSSEADLVTDPCLSDQSDQAEVGGGGLEGCQRR